MKRWYAVVASTAVLLLFPGLQRTTYGSPDTAQQVVPNNPSPHPAPEQPIPYSHKVHLALGLQCTSCHTNPDPGKLMTFPSTSRCRQCHGTMSKEKPGLQKLAEYTKSDKPIPWVRVYKLLPGVSWSHRKHLTAGMQCEMCHGQVAQLDRMAEITSVTSMSSCISCHEQKKASATCFTCHETPAAVEK